MNPTIFEALHESHEIQRSLLRQLVRSKGDTAKRTTLFMAVKVELKAHAAAEERFLYSPILLDDGGLNSSRHALSEHHETDELLEELSVRDKSGSAWLAKAKKLSEKVHHHLREEERKFFKVAGRILSDAQKITLARQYNRDVARLRKKYASEGC